MTSLYDYSFLHSADPSGRSTFDQAVQHTFLTTGSEDVMNDDSPPARLPCVVNPLTLHNFPAVPLPTPLEGGSMSGADRDKEWARRQCSMVWAPMPAEYSFSTVTVGAEDAGNESSNEAGQKVTCAHHIERLLSLLLPLLLLQYYVCYYSLLHALWLVIDLMS